MRRQEEAQTGGRVKGAVRRQVRQSHTNQAHQDHEAAGAAPELESWRHPCGVSRGPAVSGEKGCEQQPGGHAAGVGETQEEAGTREQQRRPAAWARGAEGPGWWHSLLGQSHNVKVTMRQKPGAADCGGRGGAPEPTAQQEPDLKQELDKSYCLPVPPPGAQGSQRPTRGSPLPPAPCEPQH